MPRMLVSVIVPVYDVAPYLDEALGSVVSQTYRDLEVIVVDDGSTDGSGEICEAWAARDQRVTVVHQPNGGLSHARNVGLGLATGDAVAFLDPDDEWLPEFVERMVVGMERSGADVVACRYIRIRDGGPSWSSCVVQVPRLAPGLYDRDDALHALADGELGQEVWDKLYRCSLWEGVRFPEGRVYEDVATTYRILDSCEGLLMLDDALYLYRRMRPGGITATRAFMSVLDSALARSELSSFLAAHPETFTRAQALRWQCQCLHLLLLAWLTSVCSSGLGDAAWRGLSDDLRDLALDVGAPEVLSACGVRTRAAWCLLRSCPGLFSAAYPPYRALRDLGRTLAGG